MVNATPVASVETAMQKGFDDAMDRVKELGLEAKDTLVGTISRDAWKSRDASDENPNVIDQDGLDTADIDDDPVDNAA